MLQVVYRPLKSLSAYAKNSRTHSPQSITKIADSLCEFGWTNAPLIADGTIICGHARIQGALQLAKAGIDIPGNPDPWQCPTVDISHFSKQQRAAYVIADNRLALDAGWDQEILSEEMGWLAEDGFDLNVIGFDEDELATMLGGIAPGEGADPDDIPETPLHPVTELGDVWILGNHRVTCGDSTDFDVVNAALAGVTPSLCIADPPNGIVSDPSDRGRAKLASGKPLSSGKRRAVTVSLNASRSDWAAALKLFPGDVLYLWHAANNPAAAQKMLEDSGFEIRSQIIWAKSQFVVSRGNYHSQHEPCMYAVRKAKTAHWSGDRKQSTLWQIDKQAANTTGQAAEKPIECFTRPIENNSNAGQTVYDPFAGAGGALIACEISQRHCVAIELSPAMVDVIIKRWSSLTGETAIHEATGKPFEEMTLARPFGDAAA